MENQIIKDRYVQGSGWERLFFRKKGTEFQTTRYDGKDIQAKDAYIVQFEGKPSNDSGYDAQEFDTLEEALAYWNED